MNKQAHLRTIAVFGIAAILVLLAIYLPLVGAVLFSIISFIALYFGTYTLFKD